MATYECSKCGMSVNATCGKCNDHGKIKSPLCCGQDMTCSV